jgi:hypothetical protein
MTTYPDDPANRPGGAGRAIVLIAVVAVAALALAWALGLFNLDTSGKLEAPRVAVTGGEVPDVQVETADIDVGTKTTEIEVPTVEVTPAGDDGKANR